MRTFNIYDFIEFLKAILALVIWIATLSILLVEYESDKRKKDLDNKSIKELDVLKRLNRMNERGDKHVIKFK
jgi:hypothetical protein